MGRSLSARWRRRLVVLIVLVALAAAAAAFRHWKLAANAKRFGLPG